MIKFLIANKSIDCTVKNNQGKLALDCMVDHASKAAFFDVLVKKFFAKELNLKTENFVVNSIFYSDDISKKGRLYYFLMTLCHYPEKSWFFLDKGINVNGTYKRVSPLACAINPWLKTSWRKIPSINKYNICALLAHGAKVDEKMIQGSHEYIKKLLQQRYDTQDRVI